MNSLHLEINILDDQLLFDKTEEKNISQAQVELLLKQTAIYRHV